MDELDQIFERLKLKALARDLIRRYEQKLRRKIKRSQFK